MSHPTKFFGLDLMKMAVPFLHEVEEMKQMLELNGSLHDETQQQSLNNESKSKLNDLDDEILDQSSNEVVTDNNDRMKAGLDASGEPSTNVQSSEENLQTTESKQQASESKAQVAKTKQQESESNCYESETKWQEPYSKPTPRKKAKACHNISKPETDTVKEKDPLIARTFYGVIKTINIISRVSFGIIPLPQTFVGVIAFYPPNPWEYYYLSYFNEEKKTRCFGNAKQCYGKNDLRIEPVLWEKYLNEEEIRILTMYLKRTEPFVVLTKSKNYIVGGKIKADLGRAQMRKYKKFEPSHKVLLIASSNACDIGKLFNSFDDYLLSNQHPEEYDVYLFDYSGFGLSTGSPTESAVYKDIEAVYKHIVAERNDPKLEIILMGISIGTAVVADLASKNLPHVTGVILIAPLTSGIRCMSGPNPPKKASKADCFRTLDKARKIKVPLLCIHGLDDDIMPSKNSTDISKAAPYGLEPLYLEDTSHLGVLTEQETGIRITTFIEDDIEQWKQLKKSSE